MGKILKNGIAYAGGGAEGKSAYQTWLDLGNIGTEQDFIDSLSGGGASLYVVTGSLDIENEENPVTLNQTFEEIKTAYDEGKTIVADILVAGEAQYIFNLLYILEDAIAFEWINSAAKIGGQINLMSDNTATFTMTSLEGGGSGESYDDTEIRELVNGKQDATIFIDATMSTVKDSWDNYLLDVDEEYRYSKVQDMLVDGKTVVLRVKVDNVLVELPCVSYESYTNATLTFAAPYYNSSTEEKGLYIAFCASTVGWKLGIKVVKEASSTDMSPFIIKSVYTEDSDGFTVDTSTTTPALWADWYPAFEAGRPVYWDLHKNSIDSNTDVIRLYPHSHGVYYEATGTKECQFIGIGGYPGYDSRNDATKYYYIGWFRSGSAPASNYKFVKRYKIDEIPKGGTTGQALVKKSDTNYDVEWADVGGDEIIHTDLSGNFEGITTVLDLANALLEEYRTEKKLVRFESGSLNNTILTDLPEEYGYLTIKAGGTNILEVTFAYSNLGFKKMYYGFLNRTADETLYSELNWEEVNTGVKEDIPIIENGKDITYHKITKNRSITELEAYTDRNGGTNYKIDDLYLTYDCEKLAKGFDDWFAEKSITPVKGTTYEDVAQIRVYSESAGGYVYLSTHIKFDNTAYLSYNIKYNDTDYVIISVRYDYDNGKTHTTFTGLNVFNIAKIIPELAGCYIQSDILDVLHNWFELYKPIGLEDAVGLYSKEEALTTQDLIVNAPIESRTVGAFDLGNIVSLMTSPLQRLLFTVDSEGANLKAYANDEKKRTTALTNGLFGNNLLASKNIFATLNDMSTLPTPPDEALGIWTVVPDAPGQPESTNKGGTLIIAHITSMLYSQTVSYIGTRIAIYVTQGAIYYALGYGGKYYPTASWTPPSGGAFRWYKIASTLV